MHHSTEGGWFTTAECARPYQTRGAKFLHLSCAPSSQCAVVKSYLLTSNSARWYGYFGVVLWVVGLNSWVHHRERPDPGVLESVESGRRCLWRVAIVPHHTRGAKVVERSIDRPNHEGQIGHTIRSRWERVELLFVAGRVISAPARSESSAWQTE